MKDKFVCESCGNESINKINISRFIDKLDSYFKTNDLDGAYKHLKYFENEARSINDSCGLLSILNEELGFFRRNNSKDECLKAIDEVLELLEDKDLTDKVSGATIYVNAATSLKAFGKAREGLSLYDKAEEIYKNKGKLDSFEYASLLNNKGSSLADLSEYDLAINSFNKAIDILIKDGKHDGEIAVSLVNKAHALYDLDSANVPYVEETLDKAWEYINSSNQPHDANFAYILSKCAPSFRYFKRELEAMSLEEIAKTIYGR